MNGITPDHPVRLPMSFQNWDSITFLHYRCDACELSRLLPAGLSPDTHDGMAWISLTPLIMRRVRPGFAPPMPGWSTFIELNIRTYVRDNHGRDGLWFFSLECPRRLLVWGTNILGFPYRYRTGGFDDITLLQRSVGVGDEPDTAGSEVHYWLNQPAGHRRLQVRPGPRLERQSELDVFLTARWNAYTTRFGRVVRIPAEHEPWQLYEAEAEGSMLSLARDSGLPVIDDQPLIHYSPGVHVRLGLPTLV